MCIRDRDYRRRNELVKHPEKKLPGVDKAALPDRKFTHYLFGGNHPGGLAKGAAITSRLGYDAENWKAFQAEIKSRAGEYAAVPRMIDPVSYTHLDVYKRQGLL